uniref:Uncharacterized protein n=1 Tax=Yersinia enterocolitica TaxID=630 RepID=F2Q857_YEREN|nr:hypothetical protein Y69_0019 [Yersinia enterocolitica]
MLDTIQTIQWTTMPSIKTYPSRPIYHNYNKTIHLRQIDTYKTQLSLLIKEAQLSGFGYSLKFQKRIQSFQNLIETSAISIMQSGYHHHESKLQTLFYILYVIEVCFEVHTVANIKLPNNPDPLRWSGLVYPEFKLPRIRH